MRWIHWSLVIALTLGITGLFLNQYSRASVTSNFRQTILPLPQCSDLVDNDGDGFTDFPDDPDCDSLLDDMEEFSAGGSGNQEGSSSQATPTPLVDASVVFSGWAFPNAVISIQSGGNEVVNGRAGVDASFRIEWPSVNPGTYPINLVATDTDGIRSNIPNQTVAVTANTSTAISSLVFPPTMQLDSDGFTTGTSIGVKGHTIAGSSLAMEVLDADSLRLLITDDQWRADENGNYQGILDTASWPAADKMVRVRLFTILGTEVEGTMQLVQYQGADINLPLDARKADVDDDGKVDLIDLSKMIFWYKKPSPLPQFDLNKDGVVDLIDISILIYYWTG
ncbi:MAG: hypothetical protein R3B38_03030 [Patescibacteria group bacterium]